MTDSRWKREAALLSFWKEPNSMAGVRRPVTLTDSLLVGIHLVTIPGWSKRVGSASVNSKRTRSSRRVVCGGIDGALP